MPTTNTVTANYTGKIDPQYITKALLASDTLNQNLVRVHTGLKVEGINLRRIDTDTLFQDASCEFTPTGEVTLDYRQLTGKKIKVNLSLCMSDFEASWEAEDMGDSAFDNTPDPYLAALLIHIAAKAAEQNEKIIWNGIDAAGQFEGFLTKLSNDGLVPSAQNITAATLSAANIFAEIGKMDAVIPQELNMFDENFFYVVSQAAGKFYMTAQAGFGTGGQGGAGYMNEGFVGRKELNYLGTPMYIARGLTTNQMIAYNRENLHFGTGILADWSDVRTIDMRETTGDDTIRFIMKLYAGVQYGWPEEIVMYGAPEPQS
jgi:hypothetical protein